MIENIAKEELKKENNEIKNEIIIDDNTNSNNLDKIKEISELENESQNEKFNECINKDVKLDVMSDLK